MLNVNFYRGGEEMLIPAQEKRRKLQGLAGLAGLPGMGVRRYGEYRQAESKENAAEAGLLERLSQAQTQAQGASNPPQDALYPGMLGETPPAGPPASSGEAVGGTSNQAGITEEPVGASTTIGTDRVLNARRTVSEDSPEDEGLLSKLARTGAAVAFGAYIPQEARQKRLAMLAGQIARRGDRLKAAESFGRYAQDPGALAQWAMPGIPAISRVPARDQRENITALVRAAAAGDPQALKALELYRSYARPQAGVQPSTDTTVVEGTDPLTGEPTKKTTTRTREPGLKTGAKTSGDPGAEFGLRFLE